MNKKEKQRKEFIKNIKCYVAYLLDFYKRTGMPTYRKNSLLPKLYSCKHIITPLENNE